MAIWEFSFKKCHVSGGWELSKYICLYNHYLGILSLCPVVSTPGCTIIHRC